MEELADRADRDPAADEIEAALERDRAARSGLRLDRRGRRQRLRRLAFARILERLESERPPGFRYLYPDPGPGSSPGHNAEEVGSILDQLAQELRARPRPEPVGRMRMKGSP